LGETPPLHHPCTSGGIPIGAQQHQPFSSFTSPLSTPIYNKTSHQPPHTPNLFTFKRVQTPLTQSTSRVQTQITYSLSRTQVRFMPQGFWPSYPQALAPYPILGLWFCITYLLRYNTTQHVFLPCAGFNPPDCSFIFFVLFFLSFFFPSPCDLPV